jgi:ribosomal protein S18 acetylase RimI-like enzyme
MPRLPHKINPDILAKDISPESSTYYAALYEKQNRGLLNRQVYSALDIPKAGELAKAIELLDKGKTLCFFVIESTDEFELSTSWLIRDFMVTPYSDVEEAEVALIDFVQREYSDKSIYWRVNAELEVGGSVAIKACLKNIYTSIMMESRSLKTKNLKPLDESFIVRNYRSEDLHLFANLSHRIFQSHSPAISKEKSVDWMKAWTSSPTFDSDIYFIAEKNGVGIGIAAAEIVNPKTGLAHLFEIGVLSRFKGARVADMLFQHCVRALLEKGSTGMTVRVKEKNLRARSFFKSCGFSNSSRRVNYQIK